MSATATRLAALLALLAPTAAAAPGDVSFNAVAPKFLSPAGYARHLDIVDVDGDGRLDLVRCDYRVGVWRQLDGGQLTPVMNLPYVGAAVVADLDGDGLPSLVTVYFDGVRAAEFTAPWVFGPQVPLTAPDDGGFGTFAAAADLDDDGHIDLLGKGSPAGNLRFWRGDGAGGLLPSTQAASTDTVWTELADLDLDGRLDLLAVHASSAIPLLGQGDGSFVAQAPIALPGTGFDVALGNLDGDGLVDAAVATLAGVQLLEGAGGGTFATGAVADAGSVTRTVDLFDANGDGDDEILDTTGEVHFLGSTNLDVVAKFWLPKGVFDAGFIRLDGETPLGVIATSGGDSMWSDFVVVDCGADGLPTAEKFLAPSTQALAVADVDGDGQGELVAWDGAAKQVVVREIPGDGELGPPSAGQPLEYLPAAHVVDLDGDANEDLLLRENGLAGWEWLPWRSNGDGTFTPGAPVIPTLSAGAGIEFALGDLDGDGDTDLLLVATSPQGAHTNTWYANQHDGSFGPATVAAIPDLYPFPQQPFFGFALGDVDGDGLADMFAGSSANGAGLREWKGLGGGNFAPPVVLASGPHGTQGVRVGDLDGDGHADVFAHGYTDESSGLFHNDLTVLHGHGDGRFEAPLVFRPGTVFSTVPPWPVDFDGDGRLDLLLQDDWSGRIHLLPQAADGSFGEGRLLPFVMWLQQPEAAVADVDGDGDLDLLVNGSYSAADPLRVEWVTVQDVALDLGHAKAGSAGLPVLTGGGTLQPDQLAFFDLQAAPAATPLLLVLGLQTAWLPMGYTTFLLPALVPEPQLVLGGFASDASGRFTLKARWPSDAPPGLAIYAQVWCTDPITGQLVASNALQYEGD